MENDQNQVGPSQVGISGKGLFVADLRPWRLHQPCIQHNEVVWKLSPAVSET